MCPSNTSSTLPPPGVLVDLTQNYGSAFYTCAAGMALGAVFLGLVKPAKKGLLCRRRNKRTKHPRNVQEREEGCDKEGAVEKAEERTESLRDGSEEQASGVGHSRC